MTAIITDKLRYNFSKLLFDEMIIGGAHSTLGGDSAEFYIGIGKSDQYDSADDTTINPLRHTKDEREARNNVESIMKIPTGQVSYVIPRYNWTSGSIYSAWSDHQVGYPTNSYYVMTEDNQVYMCVQASISSSGSASASTVKPDWTAHGVPGASPDKRNVFKTSDGYVWKFMYELTASKAATFLSSGYIPVQDVDSAGATTAAETDQLTIKAAAANRGGQIIGAEIVSAGTGYSTAPNITVKGDGSGAVATCTISGGAITSVTMSANAAIQIGDSGFGSGYNVARMELDSGNGRIRPIIAPRDGFGHNMIEDLKSTSIMAVVKPAGTQNGAFNVSNDFRQITLFKNLTLSDSGSAGPISQLAEARANRKLTLQGAIGSISADQKLTGDSGTVAWIDQVDSNGGGKGVVYYHTNNQFIISDKGPGIFKGSETVTGASAGSGIVDSDSLVTLDPYSGDLLYIDSRARVVRGAAQTEDIKVIVTV